MKKYSFNKNVYCVRGYIHACLYDLNKGHLIHISEDYVDFIDKIVGKDIESIQLNSIEREKLLCLQENDIITESSKEIQNGDILQLKGENSINFAWIEVTNICNLKCIHCYDESSPANQETITLKDFQRVIDELVLNDIKNIQLIGGEPLLVPYLKEMILYARPIMDTITVFTNATLLDEEMVTFFSKYQVKVAVSIYSYDSTQHDYVTGQKGSCGKSNAGIVLLKKHNVKYRVANVLMKRVCLGEKNTDLYTLDEERDVVRISGRANVNLLDEKCIKLRSITCETFSKGISKSSVVRNISGHNCFSTKIYVAANMNVYPCVMERRICHGNLKRAHLKELIKQDILVLNKDKIEECQECEFRYACFDCRPNSIEDDIYKKPWYCTYLPDKGIWGDVSELISQISGLSTI